MISAKRVAIAAASEFTREMDKIPVSDLKGMLAEEVLLRCRQEATALAKTALTVAVPEYRIREALTKAVNASEEVDAESLWRRYCAVDFPPPVELLSACITLARTDFRQAVVSTSELWRNTVAECDDKLEQWGALPDSEAVRRYVTAERAIPDATRTEILGVLETDHQIDCGDEWDIPPDEDDTQTFIDAVSLFSGPDSRGGTEEPDSDEWGEADDSTPRGFQAILFAMDETSMTDTQLADLLGWTKTTVSRIRKGKNVRAEFTEDKKEILVESLKKRARQIEKTLAMLEVLHA